MWALKVFLVYFGFSNSVSNLLWISTYNIPYLCLYAPNNSIVLESYCELINNDHCGDPLPCVPPHDYPCGSTCVSLRVIPSSATRTTTEIPRNILSESHGFTERITSSYQPPNPSWYVKRRSSDTGLRMKISVIMNISVLRFYEYIGYIGDISADILEKISISLKLIKIYIKKYKKNFIKM